MFSFRSIRMWKESGRLGKLFLIAAPASFYIAGAINTWQAYWLFKNYQYEEEIWSMIDKEGLFEDRDEAE
jgi:hypothetical protein